METWFYWIHGIIINFCGKQTQLSQNLLLLLPAHLKIKLRLLQLTRQRMLVNLQTRRHQLVNLLLQHHQILLMLLPRMLVLTQHKLLQLTLQKTYSKREKAFVWANVLLAKMDVMMHVCFRQGDWRSIKNQTKNLFGKTMKNIGLLTNRSKVGVRATPC